AGVIVFVTHVECSDHIERKIRMKRLFIPGVTVFLATALSIYGGATGRFDLKLTPEKQIVHALNRLTFGVKPGDIEQVRRMGLEKWIDLQLHPERITENPALEAKLKPLETVQLSTLQIL